jgi:hypothetical protein
MEANPLGGSTNTIVEQSQAAPQLPPDPALATEQAQAQNDLIGALQTQTQGDMASLMARYGAHLAMAGTNVSPLSGKV